MNTLHLSAVGHSILTAVADELASAPLTVQQRARIVGNLVDRLEGPLNREAFLVASGVRRDQDEAAPSRRRP